MSLNLSRSIIVKQHEGSRSAFSPKPKWPYCLSLCSKSSFWHGRGQRAKGRGAKKHHNCQEIAFVQVPASNITAPFCRSVRAEGPMVSTLLLATRDERASDRPCPRRIRKGLSTARCQAPHSSQGPTKLAASARLPPAAAIARGLAAGRKERTNRLVVGGRLGIAIVGLAWH